MKKEYKILKQHGNWLRLVEIRDGHYQVQVKKWFKWRNVRFGPFGIEKRLGLRVFTIFHIIDSKYDECVKKGKKYILCRM